MKGDLERDVAIGETICTLRPTPAERNSGRQGTAEKSLPRQVLFPVPRERVVRLRSERGIHDSSILEAHGRSSEVCVGRGRVCCCCCAGFANTTDLRVFRSNSADQQHYHARLQIASPGSAGSFDSAFAQSGLERADVCLVRSRPIGRGAKVNSTSTPRQQLS